MPNVLVVAEQIRRALRSPSLPAVKAGRQLAERLQAQAARAPLRAEHRRGGARSSRPTAAKRLHVADAAELAASSGRAPRPGDRPGGQGRSEPTTCSPPPPARARTSCRASRPSSAPGWPPTCSPSPAREAMSPSAGPMWAGVVLAEVAISTPVKVITVRGRRVRRGREGRRARSRASLRGEDRRLEGAIDQVRRVQAR